MKTQDFTAALLMVSLLVAVSASGQIIGHYYSSETAGVFSTLIQTRLDQNIDFNWGDASPGITGIGENNFAVRWEGEINIPADGQWTFFTVTDDGVRLFINDTQVINQWKDQGPTEYSATLSLTQGVHSVVMEYYENTGGAVARLLWQGPGQAKTAIPTSAFVAPGLGLIARYDNDSSPTSGAPTLIRVEGPIDFGWGTGSPHPLVNADYFSARWRGLVEAPGTGNFSFFLRIDDGGELWVDGQKLIDQFWTNQPETEHAGTIALEAGERYVLDVLFRENAGSAACRLLWEGPGTNGKEVVPLSNLFPVEILQVKPAVGANGQLWRMAQYGDNTIFAVTVTGAQNPPEFQWYFTPKGSATRTLLTGLGADTATYTHTVVSDLDAGKYECDVDDGVDVVTSPAFTLVTVETLPAANTLGGLIITGLMAALGAMGIRKNKSA